MKKEGILIIKVNQINNYPNNFRGYKNLKIVNEKSIETADNIGAIKVFFADGKQIDKKVAEANKKIAETLKSVEEKL